MKKQNKNKVSLKKLTIARISPDAMRRLEGGSSIPTTDAHSMNPGDCPQPY